MACEQILSSKDVDYYSDIYALGANLYHMFSGVAPYHNYTSQGNSSVFRAIIKQKLIPIRQLRHRLPSFAEEIVIKAMAFRPRDRYSSFIKIKEALKCALLKCEEKNIE